MPQLVDRRRRASDNTLGELNGATDSGPARNGVLRRLSADLDDDDPWVLWATVVLAVTEVSDPRLQAGRVVLPDLFAVRLDGGVAGDGGPLARGGEEGEVDLGVGLEVVGLAGLGVGVEDEVDAVSFLVEVLVG